MTARLSEELYIYTTAGSHVATVELLPGNDNEMEDAAWTSKGNIVCALGSKKTVMVLSREGDVITENKQFSYRMGLSMSPDGVICLADWKEEGGVYQSVDDGIKWDRVFKAPDDAQCWHVVRVLTSDQTTDYWALEFNENAEEDSKDRNWLRIYTTNKRQTAEKLGGVTWRVVALPEHLTIFDNYGNRLAYDGHTSIFLTAYHSKTVHVFSTVTGHYSRQLLSHKVFSSENRPMI